MGHRQHGRHLRAAHVARRGRRHARHQRQQRQLRHGDQRRRRLDQAGPGHPHLHHGQHLHRRHDGDAGGLINFNAANNFGTGQLTLNGGGLQWATGNTLDISSRLTALGSRRRHLRHQRQQRHAGDGDHRRRQLHQAGQGTLNLTGDQHLHRADQHQRRHPGGERQHHQQRHGGHGGHAGRHRHDLRHRQHAGHHRARQLDRHDHGQRQLRSGGRQHLPGGGQRGGPGRPHQRHRRAGHGDINGGTVQVPAQPGSYANSTTYTILNATRRADRHLLRCHQQLRLPDADADLRCQQRVPDPGDPAERHERRLPDERLHAQPEGGGLGARTRRSPAQRATSPR